MAPHKQETVLIVGAGLGGLSAALRLASQGWRVEVFDQQPFPGGKAGSEDLGGFRFDTGPSLLTLVSVFDQLFQEVGLHREDWFQVRRLDPITRYFYPDGTLIEGWADPTRFAQEVQAKTGEPASRILESLAHSEKLWTLTHEVFLEHSLHDLATYGSPAFRRSVLRLGGLDAWRSMDQANRRFRDPRVVQLFNRYATYNGSNPYTAPATLNMIPYVEFGLGGYAVEGGIHAIPRALERAARSLGVRFHYGAQVERILLTEGRRVAGLATSHGTFAADWVISNVDVSQTYRDLLQEPEAKEFRHYARQEPSSSGFVFYWGMSREFPQLTVNNILFGPDYAREFRQIFREKTVPDQPTVYINITSKVDSHDAPPGGENWFVLVNAPWEDGQDWSAAAAALKRWIVRALKPVVGRDITDDIVVEKTMTPLDIAEKTGSFRGSLYGISSNSRAAAFLRHQNRGPYPGLYFCGGSVHPGGGMPLVVLSGKIASELMVRDAARKRSS